MASPEINVPSRPSRSLIESDGFPCAFVSRLAEAESWRKEIYRPIYHVHKWWAKRLGSVFRSTLLACALDDDDDLSAAFHRPHDYRNLAVFDPFMGSGTTIGEAHKLGMTALGRDINPVACESVRVGLSGMDGDNLMRAFGRLSSEVGERIRRLYQTRDSDGESCDALYYFWVKQVPCPDCQERVDLFPNYMFARNALPSRRPEVKVLCPGCNGLFQALISDKEVTCPSCSLTFDAHKGPASGAKAKCGSCGASFSIGDAVRKADCPPAHRMYAKLVLRHDGTKEYLKSDDEDLAAYEWCVRKLRKSTDLPLPELALAHGHNTKQAIAYCYRQWRDFFNDRQLLALGWLHQAILALEDEPVREAMLTVFSGALEFNNLFASYKGEGTGAVRHMFAHHILKPERMPIEGNLWGTPKSSGSFSGLFKTRLFRALEYQAAPFEVSPDKRAKSSKERKIYGISHPFSGKVSLEWPPTLKTPRSIHISCGNSARTGLPARSVDLVVTDPPFFDNVHYSELADFFYAWQQLRPGLRFGAVGSTRHEQEVQDADATGFTDKLRRVFAECHRVLRDDGLLVFSYHHSRNDGWSSLARAVAGAGFSFVNAHPVRAEMSVAAPKQQAKEPIQLDSLLVCRKRQTDSRRTLTPEEAIVEAVDRSRLKMRDLEEAGFRLSLNDRRVALIGQFLACISTGRGPDEIADLLESHTAEVVERDRHTSDSAPAIRKTVSPTPYPAVVEAEQLMLLEQPRKYRTSAKKPAKSVK